jgi:homoserine O-acetyltransferase
MGAFQAYQWAISYPDFTNRIIAVAGSPQLTGYDIIHMGIIIKAIDDNPGFKHGNYTGNPSIPLALMELTLASTTPARVAESIPREAVTGFLASLTKSPSDWNDFRIQLMACRAQNIARLYNGSLPEAARHIKAKMLLVNNRQDHLVNPLPAISFSKLLPAKLLLLDNAMGHNGIDYQNPTFKQYVKELLDTKP